MPNRWIPWLLLALVVVGGWMAWPRHAGSPSAAGSDAVHSAPTVAGPRDSGPPRPELRGITGLPAFLPPEARETIALVQRDGPFPHRQDGGVFGNREGRLPRKPRGWYREYTVETPGLRHRGARRIVTGGDPPSEWYYTDDHYDSFRSFAVAGSLQ
jgi:guanyl-specific ribonuclease Sa